MLLLSTKKKGSRNYEKKLFLLPVHRVLTNMYVFPFIFNEFEYKLQGLMQEDANMFQNGQLLNTFLSFFTSSWASLEERAG